MTNINNNNNRTYTDIKVTLEKAKKCITWENFLKEVNTIPFIFCSVFDCNPVNEKALQIALLPPTKKTDKGYVKDLKTFKRFVHLFKNVFTFFVKHAEYSEYSNLIHMVFCPFNFNGEKTSYYNTFKDNLCTLYKKLDVSDITLYGAIKEKSPDYVHIVQWNKKDENECKNYIQFLQENAVIDTDKRGLYCLRLRPSNTAVKNLILNNCYTTSIEYTTIKKAMDLYTSCSNFGEKFEAIFYEKITGYKWQKKQEDNFKTTPDLYVNGKGFQLKFGRATLCRLGTLKSEYI